ncbi:MAG: ABC transporter substrate-binding protein [Spirochaetales bacterium]|jgi:peptide/nickel transport system substrate-binding protein|nr:ABC transporter substrate-binding protein [Spirochaetales bacterium]
MFLDRTRKFTAAIAAGAIALLVCAAPLCAGGQKEDRLLRYALAGNPDTLDPQKTSGTLTFQVAKSVYDTLVEPDAKGVLKPALAESWTTSADGKLWTFRLRRGVAFHNGNPFTSKDVKATIQRIKDPATASPKAIEYAAIRDILTPDDFTVQFALTVPSAPLLATLASGWSAILPASLIEAGHDFASRPVGTGPFVFETWIRDNKITLKKNSAYWMPDAPRVSGLDFRVILERAVQVQGLLTGQLDVCDLYDDVDVPLLEKNPATRTEKILTSRVDVIAINTSRTPLSNLKIRQAITHAIDKQSVTDIAYGGGEAIGTFMDFGDPYYKDFTGLYPYDPEKAKALVAESGYVFEKPLEMVVPQNYEYHIRAAQLYQEMLEKAGIPVRIRLVDWSTWLADVYQKANFDLSVVGHTGKLDPDARLGGYGTEKPYVRWLQPEVARLVEQARSLSSFEERKKIYDRVLEIMAREAPFVYIGTAYRYTGIRENVEGYIMLPKIDTPDFRFVTLK